MAAQAPTGPDAGTTAADPGSQGTLTGPTKPPKKAVRKARPPAPPVPPAETSGSEAPAPESAAEEGACFPACRDGYLCHEAQCISACNPACGEGERCTGEGQCRATTDPGFAGAGPPGGPPSEPPYYPWPPVPPRERHQEPSWEPVFPDPQDHRGARFRRLVGMFGLQLSLGGTGEVDDGDDDDLARWDKTFDLESSGGLEAALEFRLNRHFGLAPGLRLFNARARDDGDDSTTLDVLVIPTFHIPLGQAELLLPIPTGVSFGSVPADFPGSDGSGFTVGFTPGVIAWMTPNFGIYTQLGVTWHLRSTNTRSYDYIYRFRRLVLTVGMAFSD